MIKLFDNLSQSSSEITDRILSIESSGPFVLVIIRINDARSDADGSIVLPPKRLGNETVSDFQKRIALYIAATEPILEPGVRVNTMTGDVEFYPAPSSEDDAASVLYQQRVAAFEARTRPVIKKVQVNRFNIPEAIETWNVLVRMSAVHSDKSFDNATILAEKYESAIKHGLAYMSDKYPERREHFKGIIKNMDLAKINRVG